MQEFREENSDQFEHQMRINNKAAGDLPGLASRQGNAEFQEDLLTKSNTVSHADSSSAASCGDTPSASRSASLGLPCVQESAPAETRAQDPPASAATPTRSAGSAVAPDHVASPTQPKNKATIRYCQAKNLYRWYYTICKLLFYRRAWKFDRSSEQSKVEGGHGEWDYRCA
jgi:hypothetical protein